MNAESLQRIESILNSAEESLNGFVVAMERKLCDVALQLIYDIHKHLTEAHGLLESMDDEADGRPAVEELVSRYTEMTSGLTGAQVRFKRSCKRQ